MKGRLTLLFSLLVVMATAQKDSLLLSNHTKLEDGIYLTYTSFLQNKPDYSWNEVGGNIFINQRNHSAKIQNLYVKIDSLQGQLPTIWGFCRFGVPFRQTEAIDDFQKFVTILIRGRLCYYSYFSKEEKTFEIVAYNPKTRIPFRKGQVNNLEEVEHFRFFEYETGQEYDFELSVFMDYIIERDPSLWSSLDDLSEYEAKSRLYKCLLIFNDRHPVKIWN